MGQNGGKRAGAGRKPKAVAEARKDWAAKILPDAEECEYWRALLENPKTRPDALRFISEHKHGRAPQSMLVKGDIDVSISARRDQLKNIFTILAR